MPPGLRGESLPPASWLTPCDDQCGGDGAGDRCGVLRPLPNRVRPAQNVRERRGCGGGGRLIRLDAVQRDVGFIVPLFRIRIYWVALATLRFGRRPVPIHAGPHGTTLRRPSGRCRIRKERQSVVGRIRHREAAHSSRRHGGTLRRQRLRHLTGYNVPGRPRGGHVPPRCPRATGAVALSTAAGPLRRFRCAREEFIGEACALIARSLVRPFLRRRFGEGRQVGPLELFDRVYFACRWPAFVLANLFPLVVVVREEVGICSGFEVVLPLNPD